MLADLGVPDPRLAPIVRRAHHWFGLGRTDAPIVGGRPPLGRELRGRACLTYVSRLLGLVSYPIYVYLSGDGVRFVPAIDTEAFPPTTRAGPVHMGSETRRATGIRPATAPKMSGHGERWRGFVNALTADHTTARALAVADSRVLVRTLFLGSAVRLGLFDLLEAPRDLDVIAAGLGATRGIGSRRGLPWESSSVSWEHRSGATRSAAVGPERWPRAILCCARALPLCA